MEQMARLNAPTLSGRFTHLAIAAAFLVGIVWFLTPSFNLRQHINVPGISSSRPAKPRIDHPIDYLITDATREFNAILAKEKTNLHDAAQAYRDRRGRQPPPGFDLWFEFAKNSSAIVIEDFWDQIYEDLNPFWGMPAKQIREISNDYMHRLIIRDHNVSQHTNVERREWMVQWANLTQTIAQYLPDLDMPINEMDENRIVAPWETVNEYMERAKPKANGTQRMVPQEKLKDSYEGLAQSLKELETHPPEKFEPEYSHQAPFWPMAALGCAPDSPARKANLITDFTQPPPLSGMYPAGSYQGYVKNWTLARSVCDNPHIQGLHGTFIEPVSLANSKKFFPLFAGSKMPMNNEILIPAAMYWTDDPFYSGGEGHGGKWEKKKDAMIWRGAASGGRNKVDNWKGFQRHRFISMVNATSVYRAEIDPADGAPNAVLPQNDAYHLAANDPDTKGTLSSWIKKWSDVAFVHLMCFPKPPQQDRTCEYTNPWFSLGKEVPMQEQYDYKYLPDIDGNSFSGRYRAFLASTSLPIKATIYIEWHNNRIMPWKHFVPFDSTYIDIYGIMEYFMGNKDAGVEGHDEAAKEIAYAGRDWAAKVLRKEDMQLYVFRLLLEFARLCDDDRDILGWREGTAQRNGVT